MYHDLLGSRQLIVTHSPRHVSTFHLNNYDASICSSRLNSPMLLQYDVAIQRPTIYTTRVET